MKKSMKYSLILMLILPTLIYLTGVFGANSFNIGNWNTEGRVLCAFLIFVSIILGYIIPQDVIKDE